MSGRRGRAFQRPGPPFLLRPVRPRHLFKDARPRARRAFRRRAARYALCRFGRGLCARVGPRLWSTRSTVPAETPAIRAMSTMRICSLSLSIVVPAARTVFFLIHFTCPENRSRKNRTAKDLRRAATTKTGALGGRLPAQSRGPVAGFEPRTDPGRHHSLARGCRRRARCGRRAAGPRHTRRRPMKCRNRPGGCSRRCWNRRRRRESPRRPTRAHRPGSTTRLTTAACSTSCSSGTPVSPGPSPSIRLAIFSPTTSALRAATGCGSSATMSSPAVEQLAARLRVAVEHDDRSALFGQVAANGTAQDTGTARNHDHEAANGRQFYVA